MSDELKTVWSINLPSGGVGGIAADQNYIIVGSRDPADQHDLFECYNLEDGQLVWGSLTAAAGKLDYGNSPRATPLIAEGIVYTLGAFGDLSAIDLETGASLWQKNLVRDLDGQMPEWGYSASPLLIHEILVVQPGGKESALAGLDPYSGETLWTAAGENAAYASMVLNKFGDAEHLIGLDTKGMCAWDLKGKLVWRREPKVEGDFGVPSPVITRHGLVASSENNGTRLFPWQEPSIPTQQPIAHLPKADPNSHTPVAIGNRLFVAGRRLECYDLTDNLATVWSVFDRDLKGYVSLLATADRLLACTQNGNLILLSAKTGEILDRKQLTQQPIRLLSHPAIVGRKLIIRLNDQLLRIDL